MSLIKYSLLYCALLPLLFSCDKRKEAPKDHLESTELHSNKINGLFETGIFISYFHHVIFQSNDGSRVLIFDSLVDTDSIDYYRAIDAGDIFVNNIRLNKSKKSMFQAIPVLYIDTTYSNILKPCEWRLIGNGLYKSFRCVDFVSYPSYKGYSNMPDTISIWKDSFIIEGLANTDKLIIQIEGSGGHTFYKTVYSPKENVIITSNELKSLWVDIGRCEINLHLYKDNFQIIDGRIYKFSSSLNFITETILY